MTSGSVVARRALRSFSQVDTDPEVAALIAALDEQSSLPAIQRLRSTAAELLRPQPGHRLIDAGCGTGEVVRELARIVATAGAVVGVESSSVMLAEARRRAHASPSVEFAQGDITALEFADATFNGAICERVFQHLDDPAAALAELVRVTRPGGRIVVIDSDWGMHAVHGADPVLTRTIVDYWCDLANNGCAGRQLGALFAAAGMREPTIVTDTIVSTDGQRAMLPPITLMASSAAASGVIDEVEAATWLADLASAGQRGEFCWAVTLFAVAATRP